MERLSGAEIRCMSEDELACMVAPWPKVQQMASELNELRNLCAEVYQIVCVLSREHFKTRQVAKVLDNLQAAFQGRPLPHETLLPFGVDSKSER